MEGDGHRRRLAAPPALVAVAGKELKFRIFFFFYRSKNKVKKINGTNNQNYGGNGTKF